MYRCCTKKSNVVWHQGTERRSERGSEFDGMACVMPWRTGWQSKEASLSAFLFLFPHITSCITSESKE